MALARGTVVTYDGTNFLAGVRFAGSARNTLTAVKVARGLAVATSHNCIVDLGDHADPNDAVLIASWP